MYSTSLSLLAGQYVVGDVYGITITNLQGQPIKPALLNFTNPGLQNSNIAAQDALSTNRTAIVVNPIGTGANIAWDIFTLLTGTYIFNIMGLFAVPPTIIAIFVFSYTILLIRSMVGLVRGI